MRNRTTYTTLRDVVNGSDNAAEWRHALRAECATAGTDQLTDVETTQRLGMLLDVETTSECGGVCARAMRTTDATLDLPAFEDLETESVETIIRAVATSVVVWYFG